MKRTAVLALFSSARAQIGRFVALVRDPPDLVETPLIVEFVIGVYPDGGARITATKLSQPTPAEIQGMVNLSIKMLLQWATAQGVPLGLQAPEPPKPGPAQNPLRGVRP